VIADARESVDRATSMSADAAQVKQLNVLTVRYHSVGTPEEINFTVRIEPVGWFGAPLIPGR
jgi:hypothetical protein